jgi:hypothetical protein
MFYTNDVINVVAKIAFLQQQSELFRRITNKKRKFAIFIVVEWENG